MCQGGQELIPGSFAVSWGALAFIHSQTAAYIVHFIADATTATPFVSPSSPIHLLSSHMHPPSLPRFSGLFALGTPLLEAYRV